MADSPETHDHVVEDHEGGLAASVPAEEMWPRRVAAFERIHLTLSDRTLLPLMACVGLVADVLLNPRSSADFT
jgi:hypothetical protein